MKKNFIIAAILIVIALVVAGGIKIKCSNSACSEDERDEAEEE